VKPILRLVFLVSLGLSAKGATAGEEPCNIVRAASVDMSIDASGRANVPITVEGHALNLLIDTGGVDSMLSTAVVADLQIPTVPIASNVHITMFGGLRIDHAAMARDIDFGGLKAPRMGFLVVPAQALAPGVDGMLAPDVLRAYDDEFDFANAKFNLFLPDHCESNLAYWTKDDHAEIPFKLDKVGHIQFQVELDGQTIPASFDTGSSRSTLELEEAQDLFGLKDDDPALKKLASTNRGDIFKYPFKVLKFGGVSVSNPDLELFPRRVVRLPGPPELILGMGIIRQLRLYIAYKERKLYVTPASAH
jgi:predicted aspartyl protease